MQVDQATAQQIIKTAAESLVAHAKTLGVVLTIEQKSLEPLAMGHYETVVSVRPDLKAGK